MTLNAQYAEKITAQILDALQAAEGDLFPGIGQISEMREQHMTHDAGLRIQLHNGAEINIIVQALTPAGFDDDDDCDGGRCEVCGQISPHTHDYERV